MKLEMINPITRKIILVNDQESFENAMLKGFLAVPGDIDDERESSSNDTPAVKSFDKAAAVELLQDDNMVDAAITFLGNCQTQDEIGNGDTSHLNGKGFSACYGRTGRDLWIWVTGKQPRTGEVKWQPKSLAHTRSLATFRRYINNHGLQSATELGRKIALVHWRQLEPLAESSFQVPSLPKADRKKKVAKTEYVSLAGAEVKETRGKATKLLWDSRYIWVPTSQMKTMDGELKIAKWIAEQKKMI